MEKSPTLMIQLLEERLALLQKHVATLKKEGSKLESADAARAVPEKAVKMAAAKIAAIKDHDKPKKSPNAFALYTVANMKACKLSNPTKTTTEMMSILAKSYGAVAKDVKAKFEKEAATLKSAYDKLLAAYTLSKAPVLTPAEIKKNSKKRKSIEPDTAPAAAAAPIKIQSPAPGSDKKKKVGAYQIKIQSPAPGSDKKKKKKDHKVKTAKA